MTKDVINFLKQLTKLFLNHVSAIAFGLLDMRTYLTFRDLTMIPPLIYLANLRIARKFRHLEGCVIECGVWRGGMIGGLAKLLGKSRKYYLFDSFEGLPKAQEIDGEAAIRWQNTTDGEHFFDNCRAEEKFAKEAMRRAGIANASLIKGYFDQTIPGFAPEESIAVLRLDGDWYESTMTCLKHLYPHVCEGGVVMLDDYYTWDGCARAVHDFLAETGSVARLEKCGSNLCFFVKRDATPVAP